MKRNIFQRKIITALTITFALATVFVSGPLIMITAASGDDRDDSDNGIYANSAQVIAAEGYHEALDVNWDEVGSRIATAIQEANGGIVDVLTGDAFEVPDFILKFIAGSDVALALQARSGLAFSVSGRDMDKTAETLKITLSSSDVPEAAKRTVLSGAMAYCEFGLKEKGALPVPMNVHMFFGPEYADKVAVLYSYDEAKGSLRFLGTFGTNGLGQAMFELRQGGAYLTVVMDQAVYTVMHGDTISHIAGRYGTTVKALSAANPQIADIDLIHPGQVIRLY